MTKLFTVDLAGPAISQSVKVRQSDEGEDTGVILSSSDKFASLFKNFPSSLNESNLSKNIVREQKFQSFSPS